MVRKTFFIIAYDISNDKRRTKLAKLLEEYGTRINYSVFEFCLKESDIKKLKKSLIKIPKSNKDSVVIYYLCDKCLLKNEYIGCIKAQEPVVTVV